MVPAPHAGASPQAGVGVVACRQRAARPRFVNEFNPLCVLRQVRRRAAAARKYTPVELEPRRRGGPIAPGFSVLVERVAIEFLLREPDGPPAG
jgi:hypothetical protein